MHEMSVATHLLNLCIENAESNSAKNISKITIKIGKLSGVEPHFLTSAFDVIKVDTLAANAELVFIYQDVVARCDKCKKDYQIEDYYIACPECGNVDVKIIDGEELILMSLELDS
jgi:hydrogenase nickel incorporation protein HypA/HybF